MPEQQDPLKNIVYISIPDNIPDIDRLPVDSSRLLPVEINPDSGYADLSNLSWEMIIAAALKILAYDTENEHAEYYRKLILSLRPDIHSELTNAAVAKAREKSFDIAEEIFLSLTGLFPDDFISILNLSLLYEERADSYTALEREDLAEKYNQKASDRYRKLLAEFPDSPEAHFNIGLFHLKRNDRQKAAEHLEFYSTKGNDPEKKKKIDAIVKDLRDREKTDSLFYQAYDSIQQGHEEEAIRSIKSFIEKSPGVWNAWFLLGWAYRRSARYEEGAEAFIRALELGSDQIDLYNELAICLMETGRLKESRENLLIALKAEPENVKIISNLGILSLKENRIEDAREYFRQVLEINPEDRIASEYLSRLG